MFYEVSAQRLCKNLVIYDVGVGPVCRNFMIYEVDVTQSFMVGGGGGAGFENIFLRDHFQGVNHEVSFSTHFSFPPSFPPYPSKATPAPAMHPITPV